MIHSTDANHPSDEEECPDRETLSANGRTGFLSNVILLFKTPTLVVGVSLIAFWVVCAIFGHALVPYDPLADDLLYVLSPPDSNHWFGTDQLGRDIFSRVIVGSRDILTVAPLATLLGAVCGTALGLVTGYFGGFVDEALSRLIEAFMALPLVVVALLALVALGPSTPTVIVVIGLSFAPVIARTVRAAVLSERNLDYVVAAKLRLDGTFRIMFFEILPNITAPIVVESTVRLGYAIFAVATLSFLGFGIQPPSPDWGLSVAANYGMISGGFWWTVLFDAAAIASLVVAINLVADGIGIALHD